MCGASFHLRTLAAPRLHRLEIDRMQLATFAVPGLQTVSKLVLKVVSLTLWDIHDIFASAQMLEQLWSTLSCSTPFPPRLRRVPRRR